MPSEPPKSGARTLTFHAFLLEQARSYLERFGARMPARLRRILDRIRMCRSGILGGHLFLCPACGKTHFQYHSCNDRHCPQCGQADADAWLARQQQRLLLPVPYFLVTFTVPDPLRQWIRSHLHIGLDALFGSSAQALQDLAGQPKHLGAQLGFLGVLHTWSRTLIFHPHVHYLVPGGGLSTDGLAWIAAKPNYLLPVKALGARVRALYREEIRKADPAFLSQIPTRVWKQKWVVHCQPAGSGENALRYLARYVFRTATANRVVTVLANGKVRWPYRDSQTGRPSRLDFEPHQLISRFLQHVLPSSFCRVRLFGWLHPAARLRANRVRALLRQKAVLTSAELQAWRPPEDDDPAEPGEPLPPPSRPFLCPRCHLPMQWLHRWKAGQMPPEFWAKARPPP